MTERFMEEITSLSKVARRDLWLCGWDVDEDPRCVDAIFGPIPEFELEGEA